MAHRQQSSRLFTPLLSGFLLMIATTSTGALQLDSGERTVTLIELYTSQGCSSCPPAERWLGELRHHPRLWQDYVPLAFHVDYWDYIGWKDKLATPAYTSRQMNYHREGALRTVYTPAFVVNGREWRSWFRLRSPSAPTDDSPATGRLTASLSGDALTARFQSQQPVTQPLTLNVALLGVGLTVEVARGENAGKTLTQDFSVLGYKAVTSETPSWSTTLPRIDPPAGVRTALALWVSTADSLMPLQAVGGWLHEVDES